MLCFRALSTTVPTGRHSRCLLGEMLAPCVWKVDFRRFLFYALVLSVSFLCFPRGGPGCLFLVRFETRDGAMYVAVLVRFETRDGAKTRGGPGCLCSLRDARRRHVRAVQALFFVYGSGRTTAPYTRRSRQKCFQCPTLGSRCCDSYKMFSVSFSCAATVPHAFRVLLCEVGGTTVIACFQCPSLVLRQFRTLSVSYSVKSVLRQSSHVFSVLLLCCDSSARFPCLTL